MKFETEKTAVQENSSDSNVIDLPLGLVGFPELKQLEILYRVDQQPFMWLQSTGDLDIAFLVIQPYGVVPQYNVEINDQDAEFLGISSPEDAILFNIVTLQETPKHKVWVNLTGPIVVNKWSRRGKQVVIENYDEFSSRHMLFESQD